MTLQAAVAVGYQRRFLLSALAFIGVCVLACNPAPVQASGGYGQGSYYGQGYYQAYYQGYYQGYYQSYYQGTYYSQATYYAQGSYIPPAACSISATPNPLTQGNAATLSWTSTNASTLSISQSIGAVATAGSRSVSPSVTTTYTATMTGPGGGGTCATTVVVNSPAQTGTALTGYAWSDTIGWVDFNCANTNSCGTQNWGMSVTSGGLLNGLAWSEHIGWISANSADLSGCPSGVCSAQMSRAGLTGWFKALGAAGEGWDGWISLSGSGYGPTLSNHVFSGYAWGSDVVGWLSFNVGVSPVSVPWDPCVANFYCSGNDQYQEDSQCVQTLQQHCGYQCVSGVCILPPPPKGTLSGDVSIRAVPSLVKLNATASITWGVTNVTSCSIASNTNADAWSGSSGTQTTSAINQQTVYTLTCVDLAGVSSVVGRATVSLVPQWQEK